MIKYFFLIVIAWLGGLPGSAGLLLLGLYFFHFYFMRYRGFYGRLDEREESSLVLSKDVDRLGMRTQGDIVPWWGTSKHVIRKWTWDKLALETELQLKMEAASAKLTIAFGKLGEFVKSDPKVHTHPYSGTLAAFDPTGGSHTPEQALTLVTKALGSKHEWSNRAIAVLGGAFIICAESYKKPVAQIFKDHQLEERRMARDTDAELSRFTWKLGQFAMTLRFPTGFADFIKSVLRVLNPWDKHAVVTYKGENYYAPTTMFGASATIMKVLKLCEAIGLDEDARLFVGYAVALHWIDKYLMDDTWIQGGTLVVERHSLLEALQGMYAYIDGNPNEAAKALVALYEQGDAQRSKLE